MLFFRRFDEDKQVWEELLKGFKTVAEAMAFVNSIPIPTRTGHGAIQNTKRWTPEDLFEEIL